jgi:hypothetical protein
LSELNSCAQLNSSRRTNVVRPASEARRTDVRTESVISTNVEIAVVDEQMEVKRVVKFDAEDEVNSLIDLGVLG